MNIGEGQFSLATWNSTFNWTRTAMSLKFPTFSRRFRTLLSLGGPILYGLVGSLGHARLTAIKSAFGLDIIKSTLLCQNKFGPRKSSLHPLLFETQILFSFKILLFLDSYLLDIYKIKNIKQQNDTYLSFKSQNNFGLQAADVWQVK